MCIFVHHLCWHQKPLSRLYDLTLTVAMIQPITCQQICKPLWFNQSPVSKYANHCDLTNHLSANPSDSTNHLRQTTCKIKTCSFHYLHSWPPVNLFQVNDSEGGGVGGWGRGGRGEKADKKTCLFFTWHRPSFHTGHTTYIHEIRDVIREVFTDSGVGSLYTQQIVVASLQCFQLVLRVLLLLLHNIQRPIQWLITSACSQSTSSASAQHTETNSMVNNFSLFSEYFCCFCTTHRDQFNG